MKTTSYELCSVSLDDLPILAVKRKEGLILQGCGGNLNEWVEGINELFISEQLIDPETPFQKVFVFQDENQKTCLLFPFEEGIKLNMGKLAIWRIRSHTMFGGTWLSDYADNYIIRKLKEENNESL